MMTRATAAFLLAISAAWGSQIIRHGTTTAAGSLEAGMVVLTTATCPAGYNEAADLAGVTLVGTVAANADAGTTGGSDTLTPAGTNSAPALTMNSYTPAGTNGTPALTMNAYTPGGSLGTPTVSWPANVPGFAGTSGTVSAATIGWPVNVPTHTGTAASFSGNAWGAPAIAWPAPVPSQATSTFAGSALGTHQHEEPFQDPSASGTTNFRGIAPTTFGTGTSRAAVWGVTTTSVTTAAAVALSQAVSAGTPAGTITNGAIGWPASVPTIGAYTPAGSVSITNQGAVAWPANPPTNGTTSFTPAGTVAWPLNPPTATAPSWSGTPATLTGSVAAPVLTGTPAILTGTVAAPAFVGTPADNRSKFVKVVFCRKT